MDGKWRKKYITFTEDEISNNKYRLLFINKNRHGETGDVLLLKFESHMGKFVEIGLCDYVARRTLTQGRKY
jgi:replicative DNA helicase